MYALLKTTTASAALAAALSASPAALSAQETAPDETTTAETTDTSPAPNANVEMEPSVTADAGAVADPPATPNEDMQAVLDKLAELGAQPISELSVEDARSQPTPADAVMAVMEERGIEMPEDLAGVATRDITYPGADGSQIDARVYTPAEGEGPFPLIVYYHGGGWVIAGIDVYDASARALAAGANAVVVSATYRQAPGATFPTQHEDANAAYEWIVENSGDFNADAERLAIAGESAGGNLALNVAMHARDAALIQPDHVLSVYPIASDDMQTPSYETYADATPLSRAGMEWFEAVLFASPKPVPRADLARIVGQGAALDLLLDDLAAELADRPYEVVRVGEGWMLRTRPAYGAVIRAAADLGDRETGLSERDLAVLAAIAYHQPVTRDGLRDIFGYEVSRDLIGRLAARELIAPGPRAPRRGAPYTYVTTPGFLAAFGMADLRDLPDVEALRDAGVAGGRVE